MEESNQIGVPVYLDEAEPFIADNAFESRTKEWYPANGMAIKLIRCIESIRDMGKICVLLEHSLAPAADKRLLKQLATPLYSLADSVRDVYIELENSEFKHMVKEKRRKFIKRKEDFCKNVLNRKDNPLKIVRDKIGAHIDKDTILGGRKIWQNVDLRFYIEVLRSCLIEFDVLLRQDVYAWTRNTGSPDYVQLMTNDGITVEFAKINGELEYITSMSMDKSPKLAIMREANEFVLTINKIGSKASSNILSSS